MRATHEGALACCSLADLKRFAVDLARCINGFHGRNHGRETLITEMRDEFYESTQQVSLVGAVGIEPTTSPV